MALYPATARSVNSRDRANSRLFRAIPTIYPTPWAAHQRSIRQHSIRQRQKPLSPRNMIATRSQWARSALNSSDWIPQVSRASSTSLGRKWLTQQVTAAEHVQEQVAVPVIVGMEEPFLQEPVQGRVSGVKVQHPCHRSGQYQPLVHLGEQLDSTVAGDVATAEIGLHLVAFDG